MDYAEKMQRCHEYVEALEEERRKIQVFQRELPLCLELVTQAIEAYRRELSGTTTEHVPGQSDCSEQTSSDAPVLEEFIPIKRSGYGNSSNGKANDEDHREEDEDDDRSSNRRTKNAKSGSSNSNNGNNNKDTRDKDHKRKSDWLRSVQLWNQSPDPSPLTLKEEVPRKAVVTEVKRNGTGGAFQPFQREKGKTGNGDSRSNGNGGGAALNNKAAAPSCSAAVPASAASSSTVGSGGETSRKDEGQRKQRRCWSPELHRRFLHALQQLGGSHVATPKQIRELMKVDGLTNDEVKSHLQKYRLHTRRPSPTIHNNTNPQAPQFVVVGGIWVPPPEYATVATATTGPAAEIATTAAAPNGIYGPVPTTPSLPPPQSATVTSVVVAQKAEQQQKQKQKQRVQVSEGRGSDSEGGHVRSNSPATSSSTHTTTTSPVY